MPKNKIVLGFLFSLVLSGAGASYADWSASPYLEYRHALRSIEPTRVGDADCPCYGYDVKLGVDFNPMGIDRWKVGMEGSVIGQTRWDSPEVYHLNLKSSVRMSQHFSWLMGYREIHNIDRASPKTTQIVDWNHFYPRHSGEPWWGMSGVATWWTGFRVDLK